TLLIRRQQKEFCLVTSARARSIPAEIFPVRPSLLVYHTTSSFTKPHTQFLTAFVATSRNAPVLTSQRFTRRSLTSSRCFVTSLTRKHYSTRSSGLAAVFTTTISHPMRF